MKFASQLFGQAATEATTKILWTHLESIHNCEYSGFKVAHWTSNMEMRLNKLFISSKVRQCLTKKMN